MKLHLEHVAKSFEGMNGRVAALEDISFDVSAGEFVCLLGPSGCGKSTLLNIIAGLEQADSGDVVCDGKPVTAPGTDRIMIFQDAALFPWLNVMQNVEFGLTMDGMTPAERESRALRYLSMVNLLPFRRSAVHELSGGMKQRVALARSLVLNPDVLLMDEPFCALDAQTRDMLHNELQEIWASTHKTVLFVTHNVREAIRLGDRVLLFTTRPGRIKKEFTVDLPRPRQMEDHALVDLSSKILAELREEVNRALRLEAGSGI